MSADNDAYRELLSARLQSCCDEAAGGGGLAPFIEKAAGGEDLAPEEAAAAMKLLMQGSESDAAVAAVLIALERKGYSDAEIAAFADTMRSFARKVEPKTARDRLTDTCGTGGDGIGSVNVSTTVGFIVAAAGVPVAKHGNRAASSKCGSADVLEELGVAIELEPEQVAQCIDEVGKGFLFARTCHPAMKHVAGVRVELGKEGIRTVFNFLGPLTNPAGARRQLLGISRMNMMEPMINGLKKMGMRHAMVVCGLPTTEAPAGMDEVSILGPTRVAELGEDGEIKQYEVHPRDFGLSTARVGEIKGGDAAQNATVLKNTLAGKAAGPVLSLVYLNAAAGLVVGGAAADISDGLGKVEKLINEGAATDKLEQLVALTQKLKQ